MGLAEIMKAGPEIKTAYPRIYLAIDNCFASKRWTRPSEWMELALETGVACIEASADNECDPLYTCPGYMEDWAADVLEKSEKTGARVVNLYSGHGTYTTLGLAHTDARVRDRIMNDWLKAMAKTAGRLGCGLGFFYHAFPDSVLHDREMYEQAIDDLYERLALLASYAFENKVLRAGVEQMYSPHQVPWTIKGAQRMLKEIYKRSGVPFYITIDTGHQTGQRKFMRPGYGRLKEMLRAYRSGEKQSGIWLGPKTAYGIFRDTAGKCISEEDRCICALEKEMDKSPHMFSEYEDGDTYVWLEKLGCFSPIIHLQQTDGRSSSHQAFTRECNKDGIIDGKSVLKALKSSYEENAGEDIRDMPPKCDEIYLTIEIFSGTADIYADIIGRLKESVMYWREYIPRDGVPLDELC